MLSLNFRLICLNVVSMQSSKKFVDARIVKAWQVLLMLPAKLFLYIFIRSYNVKFNPSIINRQKYSYVLAANHIARTDPQIIGFGLPAKLAVRLSPIYFMTANAYIDLWWLKFAALAFGCFPAKEHSHYQHGIPFSEYILGNDIGTIMIYPEGKMTRPPQTSQPKPGVKILARIPNTLIIPVCIRKTGFRYDVVAGKPEDMSDLDEFQIMKKIFALGEN